MHWLTSVARKLKNGKTQPLTGDVTKAELTFKKLKKKEENSEEDKIK